MATIGLLASDPSDAESLSLLAGEAGYLVSGASRLHEAVEILRERRPKAMLVVDEGSGTEAEILVREVLRVSPLLPVVVALKKRDANRAVSLMRAGAAEVIAPPWTRENVRACLAKTLRYQGTAFSVVRAAPRRSPYFYFFAVLAFFGAAFGVASVRRQERLAAEAAAKPTSWELPYKHPAALAFDGGRLWIADWFTQSLYLHSPETIAVERVIHFTAETPVALTFAADSAWTATASGAIVRHMKDSGLSQVQRYPGGKTLALAFDGLYLWTYDASEKKIFKRLVDADLSVAGAYRYPGLQASALTWDGKALWSLDAGNRELIRHNLDRPDEALERRPLREYFDGKYRPVGVAWDGRRFWTVGERIPKDSGPARLFAHPERP